MIKKLNYKEIQDLLNKLDTRIVFEETNVIPDDNELYKQLKQYVDYENISQKAVLGIDIFKYSLYGEFQQTMLPFIFDTLFKAAIRLCLTNHPYLFQKYSQDKIEKSFISTGDGGFLILDTPLHALIFASNFAIILRVYNSYHFYPRLRNVIGKISVRYAITYDSIYSFKSNYYGRAVINNARVLVKDNLNRCLIDEHAFNWFMTNIDGVENLQILTIDDISNIQEFRDEYDRNLLEKYHDEIFEPEASRKYGIINADILEIGKITSKDTELNIYNLHIQACLKLYNDDNPNQNRTITVSLGNLNTSGI